MDIFLGAKIQINLVNLSHAEFKTNAFLKENFFFFYDDDNVKM